MIKAVLAKFFSGQERCRIHCAISSLICSRDKDNLYALADDARVGKDTIFEQNLTFVDFDMYFAK